MTRDDIIRMAREVAGVSYPAGTTGIKIGMSEEHLEHFANLVAAHEREACAKVAENGNFLHNDSPEARFGKSCAIAIRERGAP
jgi:hypothetical protein